MKKRGAFNWEFKSVSIRRFLIQLLKLAVALIFPISLSSVKTISAVESVTK